MSHREDKSFTVQSRAGKVIVVNQGYLKKKSPKTFMGFTQWQERFFVLEKDKLLYYKTDRARSMGEAPNGTIAVAEIRTVSIPQDHKDGCRLDLETTSRRIFELQAGSASDCQRWLNLLTIQCRTLGTLTDLSDEKAVDEQHEKDLALMLQQNAQRGAASNVDSSGNQALGPEPDFTEDELVYVEPEVTKEMEQYTISVSLDLQGINAEKVAPFVVVFSPSPPTVPVASIPVTVSSLPSSSAATAASPAPTAGANSIATPASSGPSSNSSTYYQNLETILCDSVSEKQVLEVASSIRPNMAPFILLYGEIRNFKLSNSSLAQATTATNIWQRFLRKGAADFVAFPTSTNGSLNLVEIVHDALKKRQITYSTFDGLMRHIIQILRQQFWPVYVTKYPQALSLTPTIPSTISNNPAQIHQSSRRIVGSFSSGTGVQVSFNKQQNTNTLNGQYRLPGPVPGYDELCRTEALPRLGKKSLTQADLTFASSSSSSSAARESISMPNGALMMRAKSSIIGGEYFALASRLSERRHFDVLLGINLELGHAKKMGADKRVKKLNGLDLQRPITMTPLSPVTPASIAAARARRISSSMGVNKALVPDPLSGFPKRRSSSFDASSIPGGPNKLTAALAAAASTKALDESDASLGRVQPVSLLNEEGDEEDDQQDDDANEDGTTGGSDGDGSLVASANVSPMVSRGHSRTPSGQQPAVVSTSPMTITFDKDLKSLRFHLYHQSEVNNDDLHSHILLGRVECSLKEILMKENGELTRQIFMMDGPTSGLTGTMHLMFHDCRKIKIANTPRYCYRSYIFRDISGQDLICHESLQESPFTFKLPHAALARAVDHTRIMRKQLMSCLSETDANISSGKNSVEAESQKSQMLSFMQRQVKAYTAVIAQWERLVKLYYNYQGIFHGLRFKPSVEKNSKVLAFVPINCHVQTFTVTHTGRSRTKPLVQQSFGTIAGLGGSAQALLTTTNSARNLNLNTMSPPSIGRTAGVHVHSYSTMNSPAVRSVGSPNGMNGVDGPPLPAIEATSFLFEQADFLSELRQQAALRQNKGQLSITTSASPVITASSPTLSPSPATQSPEPISPKPFGSSTVKRQQSLGASLRPLQLPKPAASVQTKAVAQMIANSHAMAAANYSASVPNHSSAPAFLSLSPAGTLIVPGSNDASHRATMVDSTSSSSTNRREQPKLNFTADENQSIFTAFSVAPNASAQASGENNLEKARLYRKVPPRLPTDHSYATHHYLNTTCGAFSAHHLGFKSGGNVGGMMKLITRLYEQLAKHQTDVQAIKAKLESSGESSSSNAMDNDPRLIHALLESGQKVLSQQWDNQQRQHTVLAQAMTAVATSFVAQLLSSLHQVDVWRRLLKIGYLQQIEGLLSTFHNEQYMIQDQCFAVRALEYCKFTIVEQVRCEEMEVDELAFGSFSGGEIVNKMAELIPPTARTNSGGRKGSVNITITAPPPPPPSPPNVPAPRADSPPPPPPPPPPPASTPPPPSQDKQSSAVAVTERPSPQLSPIANHLSPPLDGLGPPPPLPPRRLTSSEKPAPPKPTTQPSNPSVTPPSGSATISPLLASPTLTPANTSNLVPPSPIRAPQPAPSSPTTTVRTLASPHITPTTPNSRPPPPLRPVPARPTHNQATGPAPSHEDFISAEDPVALTSQGLYPTVGERINELNAINVSLLLPSTAAPISGLPYAVDQPGQAAMGAGAGVKKTKWFTMASNGSGSSANSPEAAAAAMNAAEAAGRAANSVPFTNIPQLPNAYSASTVVIVIELPPYLYRLLPACLREIDSNRPTPAPAPGLVHTITPPPPTSPSQLDDSSTSPPTITLATSRAQSNGSLLTPNSPSILQQSSSFEDANNFGNGGTKTTPQPISMVISTDGEAPQLSSPLIDIWPILITQGVNELQTMANKVGKTELQQQINLYSLEVLKSYFISYAKYQKAHLDVISASSKERLRMGSQLQLIGKDLQACEIMIQSFNAEKNIQLLVLCADIVKKMNGGRIVCCKSAKDRTSMAVTWDQARVLYEQHGLSEHDVQTACNLMRTEGVRKLNVVKNTGQSAYAFNVLQRSFLPPIFRPPEYSCSSSIEG